MCLVPAAETLPCPRVWAPRKRQGCSEGASRGRCLPRNTWAPLRTARACRNWPGQRKGKECHGHLHACPRAEQCSPCLLRVGAQPGMPVAEGSRHGYTHGAPYYCLAAPLTHPSSGEPAPAAAAVPLGMSKLTTGAGSPAAGARRAARAEGCSVAAGSSSISWRGGDEGGRGSGLVCLAGRPCPPPQGVEGSEDRDTSLPKGKGSKEEVTLLGSSRPRNGG